MPGLFDNNNNQGGILSGLGTYFNNIAGNMDPDYQENLFRRRAYQALSQQNGPQDAAILMGNPQAYGLALQRQLFVNQLQDLIGPDPAHPKMSLSEALYRISPEGQKQQYGYAPGQPIEPGPGVRIPTYIHGGQPVIGLPGAGIQGQPSQQPAAAQPQPQGASPTPPGMAQMQPYIDWAQQLEARKAAAVKAAEQTATAQPDLPILQQRTGDLISRLERIRDNEHLPEVVGGPLGVKGRIDPSVVGREATDLVNDMSDANNALQGDLFSSMRTISNGGRPPSAGTMKEMRITDLMARTGSVQGYKDNINKTIQQAKNEYESAWRARNSPDAYKPNWGQSNQAAPANGIPQVGEVRRGYKFLGGNPADQRSWQKQ